MTISRVMQGRDAAFCKNILDDATLFAMKILWVTMCAIRLLWEECE